MGFASLNPSYASTGDEIAVWPRMSLVARIERSEMPTAF
jgi:hypothetical protein